MKDNWQERFDKQFALLPAIVEKDYKQLNVDAREDIKSFIQKLLEEQKAELIKELARELPKDRKVGLSFGHTKIELEANVRGFNSCLSEVKKIIEGWKSGR